MSVKTTPGVGHAEAGRGRGSRQKGRASCPDKDVNYGLVAQAMSAVDRAGITRLSVLTVAE